LLVTLITVSSLGGLAQEKSATMVAPSKMMKLGTVDPRFVSYNVEMIVDFARALDGKLVTSFAISSQ
jgi:hypothetical protein